MTVGGGPRGPVAVTIHDDAGAAIVGGPFRRTFADVEEALAEIVRIERTSPPRWVWWGGATARRLVAAGIRPVRSWDLDAVHRLINGGWRGGPARTWAAAHRLDRHGIPELQRPDLFNVFDDDDGEPVRPDGYLSPAWIDGRWHESHEHLERWAALALDVQRLQSAQLEELAARPAATSTAHCESTAEILCAELEHDGLPIDLAEAERVIAEFIGPRPTDAAHELTLIAERDQRVLRHVAAGEIDLRNPASVKSLLRRAGVEVDDTRAWRLERLRDAHPVVDALLQWRKAERIATTFGYRWLDEHVAGGRLRGTWSGSDGAAGRMTATVGLHNLPADLRVAIIADADHVFVRADLGQIEPRILAAVTADRALVAATDADDLYRPVAAQLGVDRDVAKVAVLGAMYGQTTGHGAAALHGLRSTYPTAMRFLDESAATAEAGRDLRTRGGRLVRMGPGSPSPDDPETSERDLRSRAAARGRYGRNAMIQGAAAEFFKTWALIVRARLGALGGQIVMCLHDELLVHVAESQADEALAAVDDALVEAAARWLAQTGAPSVRFISETSIVRRWSDAK